MAEDSRSQMQRRTAIVLTLSSFGVAALLGRLFFIQVAAPHDLQGHDLVAGAVEQRRESFVIDSGRGDIFDRNGVSLTGSTINGIVVLPVWQQTKELPKINQLAAMLHTSGPNLLQALQASQQPFLLSLPDASGTKQVVKLTAAQMQQIARLNLTGIYAESVKVRYDNHSIARQVVGFLGEDPKLVQSNWDGKYPLDEKVGLMGLEYQFQDELRGLGLSHTIAYYTDADKNPIYGLGIRDTDEPNHALSVKTTLDASIQRTVENAMDQYHMQKGAVVVLDTQTEDVLAMASRPNFDQNDPLKNGQYPENLAVQAVFPGSVFKTVVAAAALETGTVRPTDPFYCPGYIDIGGGLLHCWDLQGHGWITAEDAFAQSCNVTYAQIAMKVGRTAIDEYAKKFGLGQQLGIVDGETQFEDEDQGSIFLKPGAAPRLIANTGIGQEDVKISPLQAAHMMAVIANDGQAGDPRLVQSLNTTDGLLYKAFPAAPKQQVIQAATAKELQAWCREVVSSAKGTGHVLDSAAVPVAGKTGTAQTGVATENHQWFAGFFPADHPQYAIAVVAESVPTNQPRISELVAKQIVDAIEK